MQRRQNPAMSLSLTQRTQALTVMLTAVRMSAVMTAAVTTAAVIVTLTKQQAPAYGCVLLTVCCAAMKVVAEWSGSAMS